MVSALRVGFLNAAAAEVSDAVLDVTVHQQIDSTNSWSLQQCKTGKMIPFACFAEDQTLGKGRRGKQWVMSAHSNIAMSVCWAFDLSTQPLHLLSLSVAHAIVKTLEEFHIENVQIKWPNDVYVNAKKISGVLIETQAIKQALLADKMRADQTAGKKMTAVVIGVGVNYDMSSVVDSELDNLSDALPVITDIQCEIKKQNSVQQESRELVAAVLLQNVISVCQNYSRSSAQAMQDFGAHYDFCKGKVVDVMLDNNEVLTGVAQGVNEFAELVVDVGGVMRTFNSAEISVKAY